MVIFHTYVSVPRGNEHNEHDENNEHSEHINPIPLLLAPPNNKQLS